MIEGKSMELDCAGRYFRYIETGYSGKGGRVVVAQELRPLKSISCRGCPECAGLDAELSAHIPESGFLQFSPALASGDTVKLLLIPVERNDAGVLEKWYYEVLKADTT